MTTGPKRNAYDRARDRRDIAHMYLSLHLTLAEIEYRLNHDPDRKYTLSISMIHNDLQALRKMWLERAMGTFDKHRADELARVDRLEATYQEGYIASMTITTVTGGIDGERATVRQQDGPGNPAFLAGVERCIALRIRLLGLDAPKLVQVVDEDFDQGKWQEEREKRHAAALAMLVEDEDGDH